MKHTAISRRGGYNEYKSQYITQFPVKILTEDDRRQLHNFADLSLDITKDLYDRSEKFLKLVAMEFAIGRPSAKLKKWFTLDFEDFVTALRVKLSLQQKDELLGLFEKYRTECAKLSSQIRQTDHEIDQLVYKLYDLTPEEIAIIEDDN
jgi:glutaredoxin 2